MTHYLLARTAQDYKKAHELIKEEGLDDAPLNFPTLLAWEDAKLVGVLGTDTSQNMIIAGPLAIRSDKKRVFTLLRLIEKYEDVMRACQITSYVFSVEIGTKWLDEVEKLTELKPYAEKDGRAFYVRNL